MYEQQEYKRGQIYGVYDGELLPGEIGGGRPGLVISSNEGNRKSPCVIIAYMTSNIGENRSLSVNYGPVKATGKLSMILCNQIQTVSKKRLGKLMGQLSENEMTEIDKCLDLALDLGYTENTELKEKEKEIEILKVQVKELQEKPDMKQLRVAADMWKCLYEKTLDMLTAGKLEADLAQRKPVEEKQKTDINTARFDALRELGLSSNLVLNVINNRPYEKLEDLKNVPGITDIGYQILKDKLCCVPQKPKPVKTGKVNINTASVEELAATGLGENTAMSIRAWRNKHGKFVSVEDLLNVPRFGKGCLKKYGEMLRV